jgi:hypothetical protein
VMSLVAGFLALGVLMALLYAAPASRPDHLCLGSKRLRCTQHYSGLELLTVVAITLSGSNTYNMRNGLFDLDEPTETME